MSKISGIIYASETGFTKQYAEMLGREVSLVTYDVSDVKRKLTGGLNVIYMGWLMAGQLVGYNKVSGAYNVRAVCAIGLSSGNSQIEHIRKVNKIPDNVPVFYLQGGINMEKLPLRYRLAMSVYRSGTVKRLSASPKSTETENDMLDLLMHGGSRVKKENLEAVKLWWISEVAENTGNRFVEDVLRMFKDTNPPENITDEMIYRANHPEDEKKRKNLEKFGITGKNFAQIKEEAYRRNYRDGVYHHDYNAPSGSIDNPIEVGMEGCCTTLFFDTDRGYWGLTDGLGNGWLR